MQEAYDVVVIGAGVAGLTAAACLAARGARVLVAERHTVVGGCASFYQRDGFRFDVGATLVSGFGPRGIHRTIFQELGMEIEAERIEPAMVVHLPEQVITRFGDDRWRTERLRAFGAAAEPFWLAQEALAERAWDFSRRFPVLPADFRSTLTAIGAARPRQMPLLATLGRTVGDLLRPEMGQTLRTFLDAQLLITAQTDAAHADLAYGVTALDIAREGTFHLPDGVSTIAVTLARAVRQAGSEIAYGRPVSEIRVERDRVSGVVFADGSVVHAAHVISAIPVDATIACCPALRGGGRAAAYRRRAASLPQRWGAFMLYVGLPPDVVPPELALHHQLVSDADAPLGEGNSAFLSFSGAAETRRARGGGRAVTISTHTDVARWERAFADGSEPSLREHYRQRLLAALDRVIPGASGRARLVEAATPFTFARYTGRPRGLVGGVPQTPAFANLRARSHRTPVDGLLVCGDTAFPGQSTVGASLSGYAAARAVASL